jgi:hypothetical protein
MHCVDITLQSISEISWKALISKALRNMIRRQEARGISLKTLLGSIIRDSGNERVNFLVIFALYPSPVFPSIKDIQNKKSLACSQSDILSYKISESRLYFALGDAQFHDSAVLRYSKTENRPQDGQ